MKMPRKGYKQKKSYEEIYGVAKAKEIRKKLRKAQLKRKERDGYINSPKTREKLREIALEDYKENPERIEQRKKSALEQFKNGMPKKTKKILRKLKLGKKNQKCSETKKRLYKEGILKVWNKGKKGLQVAWNKGKPNYKIRGDNNPSRRLEIRKKISCVSRGINLNEWDKFICRDPYDQGFDPAFKRLIRKRDNQICMLCGIHREKLNKALFIHHINYNKEMSIPQNCLSLCNSCHTKTNSNRKYWISFFQSLLSEKYGYEYSKNQEIILGLNK